jgi:NAD(P)-dependent dehydrogenase (short-subunit alcohol dehydrogenase family)
MKVVIIGGSSGMGLSIAKMLYDENHEVIIASRSKEKLKNAIKEIGPIESYVLDATSEKDVASFFKETGYFDHLIITAAGFVMGPFLTMPINQAKEFFESKFWSQYLAAKYGAPYLHKGGSITFFCGVAGQKPFLHLASASAINAAIEGLTRALALELAPIRVNAISPGTVSTPVWDSIPEKERLKEFERTAEELPVKKIGKPEDIAKAVRYLIDCDFATGSIVYIDGGARLV